MPANTRRLFLVVSSVIGSAAACLPGQVDLSVRPRVAAGDRALCQQVTDESMQVSGEDGKVLQASESHVEAKVAYEVLEVGDDGRVKKLKIVVLSAQEAAEVLAPAKSTSSTSLPRVEVLATRSGAVLKADVTAAKLLDDGDPLSRAQQALLTKIAGGENVVYPPAPEEASPFLPAKPVEVGSSWQVDEQRIDEWLKVNPPPKDLDVKVLSVGGKLVGMEEGLASVLFEMKVQMTIQGKAIEVPARYGGTMDPATGLWKTQTLANEMTFAGDGIRFAMRQDRKRTIDFTPAGPQDANAQPGDDPKVDPPVKQPDPPIEQPAKPVRLTLRAAAAGKASFGGKTFDVGPAARADLGPVPAGEPLEIVFTPAGGKAETVKLAVGHLAGEAAELFYIPRSAAVEVTGQGAAATDQKDLTAAQQGQAGLTAATLDALRKVAAAAGLTQKVGGPGEVLQSGRFDIAGIRLVVNAKVSHGVALSDAVGAVLPFGPEGPDTPSKVAYADFLLAEPQAVKQFDYAEAILKHLAANGFVVQQKAVGTDGICTVKLSAAGAAVFVLP